MTADAQRGPLVADDLRGDLGFGGAGHENFIPWELIAPLLTPDMDGATLCRAIVERCGLPRGRYKLITAIKMPPGTPLRDYLPGGLILVKDSYREYADVSEEKIAAPPTQGRAQPVGADPSPLGVSGPEAPGPVGPLTPWGECSA